MKAADLNAANAIVKRLREIRDIKDGKRDMSRPPQFLMIIGNSTSWLPMSKASVERAFAGMIAELDVEAAGLRRRAAQINLSLGDL